MTNEEIKEHIDSFLDNLPFNYREANYIFACHAAYPLVITKHMLYQMWQNFKTYTDKSTGKTYIIPSIVVSDLLLSNLCNQLNSELFEIDKDIRKYLLNKLLTANKFEFAQTSFGKEREKQLATFLYQYAEKYLTKPRQKNLYNSHRWLALSTLNTEATAEMLSKFFEEEASKDSSSREALHLMMLIYEIAEQNSEFSDKIDFIPALFTKELDDATNVFAIPQKANWRFKDKIKPPEANYLKTIIALEKYTDISFQKVDLERIIENKSGKLALYSINETDNITGFCINGHSLNETLPKIIDILKIEKQLTDLNLQGDFLFNIESLKELTQLQYLNLDNNSISDISAIAFLSNLSDLWIRYNQVEDLSPLQSLEKLKALNIQENKVKDLTPIQNLYQRKDFVPYVLGNPIETPPQNIVLLGNDAILEWFTEQNIFNDFITKYEKELNVTFVEVKLSQISNYKKEKGAEYSIDNDGNLTGISIVNCGLEEIPAELLKYPKLNSKLTSLNFGNNKISNISQLSKFIQLEKLNLVSNGINDISALKNLTNLRTLNLFDNRIVDLEALKRVPNLERLYLAENKIADLDALENLSKLQKLDLRYNPIVYLPEWITSFNMKISWQQHESDGITFYDNPITIPAIGIIKEGKKAIINWFYNAEFKNAQFFIIAAGGTGMRSLEAFVHLCAIGMMDNTEINILSVDTDINNGNKNKTEELINRYIAIKQDDSSDSSPNNDTFFSAKLNFYKFIPEYNKENSTFTLISQMHKGTQEEREENRALAELFFDDEVQNFNLDHGYRAQTHLGSHLMYHTILDSIRKYNNQKDKGRLEDAELTKFLGKVFSAGANARVFIFGSIFGGTGASSISILPQALATAIRMGGQGGNRMSQDALFGSVLLSNYFKFNAPKKQQIEKEKVVADANLFDLNSQAALMFYENDTTVENTYNRMYHIGWPGHLILDYDDKEQSKETVTGGNQQQNPAHLVELLTASAAYHFFNTSRDDLKGHDTLYKSVGYNDGKFVFDFKDFIEKDTEFAKKLGAFTAFSFLVNEEDGDILALTKKLAREYNIGDYSDLDDVRAKHINEYMKSFGFELKKGSKEEVKLGWIYQIQRSTFNSDFLFNSDTFVSDFRSLKKFNFGTIFKDKSLHFGKGFMGRNTAYDDYRKVFANDTTRPKNTQNVKTLTERFIAHIYNAFMKSYDFPEVN